MLQVPPNPSSFAIKNPERIYSCDLSHANKKNNKPHQKNHKKSQKKHKYVAFSVKIDYPETGNCGRNSFCGVALKQVK